MTEKLPGRVFIDRFGLPEGIEDIINYIDFLREESGVGVEPPADLSRIYARFDLPTPHYVPLANQQGLIVDEEIGLILVNQDDPAVRQRFTEAHELVELLFVEIQQLSKRSVKKVRNFTSDAKERLCNKGAAELLMPVATFVPQVHRLGVSFQTARSLAQEFGVSITASLTRMVRLGPGRHAVALWRMKNTSTEIRGKVSANQLSLFGTKPSLPPKKLRIEWAVGGPGVPFIPLNKSVPEESSIHQAWETGVFTEGQDHLRLTKHLQGTFWCENSPFGVDGERYVLSLLHLPNDVDCSSYQSGVGY